MKTFFNWGLLIASLIAMSSCEFLQDDYHVFIPHHNEGDFAFSPCSDDEDVAYESLPDAIRNYLSENFNGMELNEIERLVNGDTLRYGIEVERGNIDVELLFSVSGEMLSSGNEVEDRNVSLDELPAVVLDYIQQNFPGQVIASAELDSEYGHRFYEVHFNDDTEVYFTEDGNFICYDDSSGDDNSGDDNSGDDNSGDDNSSDDNVPITSLPTSVTDYVAANYPEYTVKKAEKEDLCNDQIVLKLTWKERMNKMSPIFILTWMETSYLLQRTSAPAIFRQP